MLDYRARLQSVGFWSWFLAVSLQVTWVTNPAVSCHYFPPGLQLPSQPLRGPVPILLLGEWWMWTVCLSLFPDSIAAAIWTGPTAPESSMLTTQLPSHPLVYYIIVLLLSVYCYSYCIKLCEYSTVDIGLICIIEWNVIVQPWRMLYW